VVTIVIGGAGGQALREFAGMVAHQLPFGFFPGSAPDLHLTP